MAKGELSREKLMPAMAGYVLENGLGTASLRPLAKAAGTSDRMLMYHFGNKQRLVADLLGFMADSYAKALDDAFGTQPAASREECIDRILTVTGEEAFAPYMRLWWEIVSGAARGNEDYLAAASRVMGVLLDWLEAHLPADDPDPKGGARYLLTLIEGAQLLRAVDRSEVAKEGIAAAKL